MGRVIYCSLFIAVVGGVVSAASEDLMVKTSHGLIKGHRVKSYEGRNVAAFEGIPYAQPPVGELRFREPQPLKPWNKTLIANKKYSCAQNIPLSDKTAGDEDCLYLYVYVPRDNVKPGQNLDVIVHIHGGGFSYGDPQTWGGYEYIMDRDLIYVSLNFRLGSLGFLSTQDEVVPGNNGLKDQLCAMKWVKNNIEHFGGNPHSITLVGPSSGGSSVHLHYLSPLSAGLFHRGISHSGTALNTFGLCKAPLQNARKLAAKLKCDVSSTNDMVDCLRKKSVKEVLGAHRNFYKFAEIIPFVDFGPVIEVGNPWAFLADHPYKLISEGRVNDCPWVVSTTKDEGIAPTGYFVAKNILPELEQKWEEVAPLLFDFNDTANEVDKTPISRAIKSHYLGNEPISTKNIKGLIRAVTDRLFLVDSAKAGLLQAKVQTFPVHYYIFDYYIENSVPLKGNISGAAHGEDVRLMYRQADTPAKLSDSDRKMKNVLVDFLYSFANKGIPTFNGNSWLPFCSPAAPTSYMHILSPDTIRPERDIITESFDFWQQLPLWENEKVISYLTSFVPVWPFYF